jgi:hypothetical protein
MSVKVQAFSLARFAFKGEAMTRSLCERRDSAGARIRERMPTRTYGDARQILNSQASRVTDQRAKSA